MTYRRFKARGALIAVAVALAVGCVGCAAASDAGADGGDGDASRPEELDDAQSALANHQVAKANELYRSLLDHPEAGSIAAAGTAVTDLMLLPSSEAFNGLLRGHLGANDSFDAQEVVYADEGFLYWVSRGATWEGQGQGVGIKRQISADLPWPDDRLDSMEQFLAPLSSSVGAARSEVVALADHLGEIEGHLTTAMEAENFDRLVIPGEAFHEAPALTLKLSRSEMAALAAVVSAARGALYYLASYRYDWSLQTAFNQPCGAIDQNRSRWAEYDCTIYFLGGRLFRATAGGTTHFDSAKSAFAKSLSYAQRGISLGLQHRKAQERGDVGPTTLQWHKVDDPTFAKNTRAFLGSVEEALKSDGSTRLQGIETASGDAVAADFSRLFDGRTLAEGTRWMIEKRYDNPDGYDDEYYWELNPEANQSFFVEGLFDPAVDVRPNGEGTELVVAIESGPNRQTDLDALAEKLFSELGEALDNAYLDSR